MSGVFRNIEPPPGECKPPAFGAGGVHTRWVEKGWGSIVRLVRKMPDTALYSIYESTLWVRERVASTHSHQYLSTKGTVSVLHSMRAEACKGPTFPKFPLMELLPACTL